MDLLRGGAQHSVLPNNGQEEGLVPDVVSLCLAGAKSTHSVRIWNRVPGVEVVLQDGREQKSESPS